MFASTITYDDFDRLCEIMEEYSVKWLPSEDELSSMVSTGFSLFIGLIAGSAMSSEGMGNREKSRFNALSKTIIKEMHFVEEKREDDKKIKVPYSRYQKVISIVQNADISFGNFDAAKEDIDVLRPYARYLFAFIMAYIQKNHNSKDHDTINSMKELIHNEFEMVDMKDTVEMSREEYEKLCMNVLGLKLEKDQWWPTIEDVETVIEPNISKCYDFVIWLLKRGKKPSSEEDIIVCSMLEKLIADHLRIQNIEESIW